MEQQQSEKKHKTKSQIQRTHPRFEREIQRIKPRKNT